MNCSSSDLIKGAGLGLAVGCIAAFVGSSMKGTKKTSYKKMAKKAIKSAEQFIDGMM